MKNQLRPIGTIITEDFGESGNPYRYRFRVVDHVQTGLEMMEELKPVDKEYVGICWHLDGTMTLADQDKCLTCGQEVPVR